MRLLIRADASARIGTGHVMRCLSLVQGLHPSDGKSRLVAAEMTPALEQRLQNAAIELSRLKTVPGSEDDAEQTLKIAKEIDASWIVVDGYRFDAEYQRAIKAAGFRLLFLDDYGHSEHYSADLVLNQNLHASSACYERRESYTRLLLGTRYALLRREFLAYQDWKRETPALGRKILVTLGGADPDNVSSLVIQAIHSLRDVETVLVVGGSNPNIESLRRDLTNSKTISLVVDAQNMPELMAWADVAVAAGGTTSWELAFMGLPSLVIVLADNQVDVATRLGSEGVSTNLGPFSKLRAQDIAAKMRSLLDDATRRLSMGRLGRKLVDGNGVPKIITRMRAAKVVLRRASVEDSRRVWEWANDPGVRASAFSSDPIPWESHQKWFNAKLVSPHTSLFIGSNGAGIPFGQIRFDLISEGEAEIDLNVDASNRKGGLGSALIRAGVDEALKSPALQMVHARIKSDNVASMRAFEKAGFRRQEIISVQGHQAWHFILERNDE